MNIIKTQIKTIIIDNMETPRIKYDPKRWEYIKLT